MPKNREQLEDDEVLVRRARSGDGQAFELLITQHYDRLFGLALALTGDADDAEDVAQSALVKIHRKLWQYKGRGQFAAWVHSIVRAVAHELHRTRRRREKIRMDHIALEPPNALVEPGDDSLDTRRLIEIILGFYRELPERQREVFGLSDLQGYSANQIAELLGIEPASVRTHLLRARRTIRGRIIGTHPQMVEEYEK